MGHSVGEYVAAVVSGVLSLEDGLRLLAARARLMQALPAGGRMAAVFAPEDRVAAAVAPHADAVSIAAINGPRHVVVSGDGERLERLVETLRGDGIRARFLNVSHAFHSPLMKPAAAAFRRVAAQAQYGRPRLNLISNLTGARASRDEIAHPDYWCRHILEPVRFADSVATLRSLGCDVFVEIGPDPVLLGMAAQCPAEREAVMVPSLRRGADDVERMLNAAARLYRAGADPDWSGVADRRPRRRIALPTYPFQRERYWLDDIPSRPVRRRLAAADGHPLLGTRVDTPQGAVFTARLGVADLPFLGDHVVHGRVVLPTTAYLEMAAAAGSEILGAASVSVDNVSLQRALSIPQAEPVTVQLHLTRDGERAASFTLHSCPGSGPWTLHAVGSLRAIDAHPETAEEAASARARCATPVDVTTFYAGLRARGLQFGDRFKCVDALRRRDGEAVGDIGDPPLATSEGGAYRLHPARLDACLQVLAAAAQGFDPADATADIYMPVAIARFASVPAARGRLVSHAWFDASSEARPETLVGYARIFDQDGRTVAALDGLQMKRVDAATLDRVLGRDGLDWFYEVAWQDRGADVAATPALGSGTPDLGAEFVAIARRFQLTADAADAARSRALVVMLLTRAKTSG